MIVDEDSSPIALADTGVIKEWSDAEVEAMLAGDEERIRALDRHKRIFLLLNKILDESEREAAEDSGATISILREKVLRGIALSDAELEAIVFSETFHLICEKLTTKEFLRHMVVISRLVDLDQES